MALKGAVVQTAQKAQMADDSSAPPDTRFAIVGIGASAGGLEAFTDLLVKLPLDTGMGFVLVQHLDPVHESSLTKLLARATAMQVLEVTDAMRVQPNHVYVIPPNTLMSIAAGVLQLQPREAARAPLRSIDMFLESLAEDLHERAIGVILSGTATDGTLGLEAIKAEGGITFAQDDSAKYDSMPRSAAAAGCVDFVLSPQAIAEELARLAKHPYVVGAQAVAPTQPELDHGDATEHQDDAKPLPSGGSGTPDNGVQRARAEAERGHGDPGFRRILLLLHKHCGVDFSLYKSSTIQRRVARRMLLSRNDTLEQYAKFLTGNAKELDALFSDVLISVTSFFRNPDAFAVLQREVLPKLMAQQGDEPLRVWVLGCSTGQEAYSIAMAFVEIAEKTPHGRKLQVFATDLNESLLEKARHGLYAKSLATDLSPERLRRFFVEEGGGYRISKPLREMVVFARQNIISDPPFSRIDLITCRNLLIYLEPALQKRVFPLFHYALKPNGFLWLGGSESIGTFTTLFEPLDRKQKFYVKKAAPTPTFALSVAGARGVRDALAPSKRTVAGRRGAAVDAEPEGLLVEQSAQREADRITVNQFAPPGVLINAERQILQFRGATGPYLEPPSGAASFDVLKMARNGLMLPLRSAIAQAAGKDETVRKARVRIDRNGVTAHIDLEVIPLKSLRERCFLILFKETDLVETAKSAPPEPPLAAVAAKRTGRTKAQADRRIAALEVDLAETRDYLQAIQATHDASNEALQAVSEEVQSANEELQSLNEELTTSKEELESSNEELTTLNDELGHRNAELMVLGSDLANLQNATNVATVLLGRDLRIRRFSLQAEQQFNLLATDVGRPFANIRHRLVLADIETVIIDVINSMQALEIEVQDESGRWFSLRIRPYVTLDNRVDGAVLMLVDIDVLKVSERALYASDAQYRAIFAATNLGICEADPVTGQLLRVNERFAQMVGRDADQLVGQSLLDLMHPDHRDASALGYASLMRGEAETFESETQLLRHDGAPVWVHIAANLVRDAAGRPLRAVEIVLDISERVRTQALEHQSRARFQSLFDSMDEGFCVVEVLFDAHGNADDFRYLEVNPAFEKLTGLTGATGKRVRELLPRIEAHWLEAIGKVALTGEPTRLEQTSAALSGRWFDLHAFQLTGLQPRGHVALLFSDVSARHAVDAALRESDRHKNEFLAMLAHELRNPLAPIRNALQILRHASGAPVQGLSHDATPSPTATALNGHLVPVIDMAVEMMERQVGQLVRLVDDLLDLSRVSLGKIDLRLEHVELAAAMHQVEQTSRPLIDAKGQHLSITLPANPVVLNADPARLVQIIGNLVNNASKFTARGGRIAILVNVVAGAGPHANADDGARSASSDPLDNKFETGLTTRAPHVTIRVRDNGIGIATAELPRIFQMFMQIDSSLGRSAGGLGIGLALVKDLVALHGGTLAVHSDGLGRGSEFEVRLPTVLETAALALPTPIDQSADAPPLRILLVDDNRDAAESLGELLQFSGHETRLAFDGLEAVAVHAQWKPDVVVLDIGLPGIDGYEAARRIRAQQGIKPLRMVALTGWGQADDRKRTADAGFDAHMVKPVMYDALLAMLNSEA